MTGIPFGHVLLLAAAVTALGMVCTVARRNLVMILLGVEGQAFVLFVIAIAAAEVSVGLAMIVTLYRRTGSLDPEHGRATD
jgi:NADH-quinone oxidoreductase subunit K